MPFQLGARSLARLEGVDPRLVRVVQLAIEISPQDFTIQQGLRTLAQEQQNVANGASRTMNSMHIKQADGFGHAVDIAPWVNGDINWDWRYIWPIAAAFREAATNLKTVIRWGGVWDRKLNDLPLGQLTAPAAMRKANADYNARFKAANPHREPLADGGHFEIGLT